MAQERVQKILAQVGLASRRKAEEFITEGLVTINGKVAKLGDKAELGVDAIKVKGKLLLTKEEPVYLAFNKPKNVISMLGDPEGRPSLTEYLTKVHSRVFPIGRLDFTSEGLILLTNDGAFAEKLAKNDDVPRVYHVKVKGHPDEEMLKRIERGGEVGNKRVKPHSLRLAEKLESKGVVEVVFIGAGAVDVKTLFETRGFLVERITRTSIGHLTLHGLKPGHYRILEKSQMEALLNQPELGMRVIEKDFEKAAEKAVKREAREERQAAFVAEREAREERRLGPVSERGPAVYVGTSPDGKRARISSPGGAKRGGPARGPRAPRDGDRPSYGDKRPGGFGARPSFGDKRPSRDGDRPERSGGFGAKRPSFGDKRPSRDSDRPSFGGRPSFGDKRAPRGPRADGERSERTSGFGARPERSTGFGAKRPAFGDKRPSRDGARSERPSSFGARPSFGDKRPSGPRAPRDGARPSFGGPRSGGAKPSFGAKRPSTRPPRGRPKA